MDLITLTTLLTVIFTLLYYILTKNYSYWKDRGIIHLPNPTILFGNLKDVIFFKISSNAFFNKLYKDYKGQGEKYVGLFMFRSPILLLTDPSLIKDIMIKNFSAFHDRQTVYDEKFDPLSAHLVGLDGQKWKYLRAKLSPTFTSGKLKAMFNIVGEATTGLLDQFQSAVDNNATIDIRETMAQYTTDVIGSAAFGLDLKTSGNSQSEFREMGRAVFAPSVYRRTLQRITNLFPRLYKLLKIRRFNDKITKFFIKLFKDTVEYRKQNNVVRNDFLQLLMTLKDTNVSDMKDLDEMQGVANYNTQVQQNVIELSDEILTAQLFIFFLAGFETSSTTMSFTLYELAMNPGIQERAAQEIEETIANYGGLTYEAINDMKYLESIINESLRKYPPIPALNRKCTQAFTIPGTDAVVDTNAAILIPIYALHHDPQYYPDPDSFNPGRFSESNKSNIVPGTYLPFGDGPRVCIGMRFAMMEMKIGFSKLLPKYRVVPGAKTKPINFEEATLFLTPKDGILLDVEPRK